ncbi:type II toxin-antitoxin system RelB/DinJ family antitoxin [Vibrio sp. HA2012]|uniref:type II toxin-antitoxin system RelB/DinJ family antitoxin n=1 Tax=Vibrio sp. HA2012 TaxID=1971595 RepID=UPI0012FDDC6C|nr:type II toxin-antitoxin system RelB/DinJ family antitoxin [Vibrio sp. HA2012]
MSYNVNLSPVDQKTKEAFAQVCEDAGLSPKEALALFTKSVAARGDIPFDIKAMMLANTMFGNTGKDPALKGNEAEKDPKYKNRFFNEMMGI